MIKTLLIAYQIAPYRIPVYNTIDASEEIDLTVWFLEEKEGNREWNIDYEEMRFRYTCLRGFHWFIRRMDFGLHINPGIFFKLVRANPDVIITTSYDAIAFWESLIYAKLFRKKFVVWWGSTLESSRVRNRLMHAVRGLFFRSADAFVTYGSDSARCLTHYGIPEEKMAVGFNTVDVRYYYRKSAGLPKPKNDGQLNLLFIGQLIKRKGLEETLLSLARLNRPSGWRLSIVGTGPDERKLRELVHEHGMDDKVFFEGYKQKEELTAYLTAADCLLVPSLIEVWGLVVNEALVSGTFVLASKYAGVTSDLIVDKENGIIADPLDPDSMDAALGWLFDNVAYLKSNRKIKLSQWKKLHPRTYANSVVRAIRLATRAGREPISSEV
ncbi:glycosyltransferase [Paenibacillus sp. NFR01]|uniref:glycosyltransferase n=1 Tax=Paenibacillus sp. NFR01 TaxID=1566279 RepID=UPI0008AF1CA4|nr:glycosyltransferase [Paenibacillus sp. NFR01]SET99821.1 Glycosyltransferase involved in cell wall bisynthesis [Paenibacillus sp. NFR01]